ncbi:MAG: RidA family protein [Chloroflexi bacterium]|nr:RidA family protein [Chloroflexota bacterium]
MDERKNISSGTPWEAKAGYSRAVRMNDVVYVSGTTASNENGEVIGGDDPGAQTAYIIRKIERALKEAGSSLEDVVQTRIYVTDITRWEEVSRVHAQFFTEILPATTLVAVKDLVTPEHMVEIEAVAVIGAGEADTQQIIIEPEDLDDGPSV